MGLVLWLPQLAILVTGPFSDLSRSLLRIISFHSLGKGQSRGRCKQYDLGTLPSLPMPTSGMGQKRTPFTAPFYDCFPLESGHLSAWDSRGRIYEYTP